MKIEIELTDEQLFALNCISKDANDFIRNFVTERANNTLNEISQLTVKYCLDENIQIPQSKEEIIRYAIDSGIVKTLAEIEKIEKTEPSS